MKHALLTLAITSLLAATAFADPIHDAVNRGDLKGVQAELDKGVDVDAMGYHGRTPLHFAVRLSQKEIAKLLITAGADVNAKSDDGATPLHYAETKEIAELLIDNGADVNAKGKRENTPLHDARTKEIAEMLIAAGADLEAKNKFGWTPLLSAADRGHKEIVELLIDNGADVNAINGGGWTPLHTAAYYGRKVIAELLIAEGADVNAKSDDGATPLHGAAYGHKEIVELLIAAGADVNPKRDDGWTPLHRAAEAGHTELVELLIAEGANVNAQLDDGLGKGETPIEWAANDTIDLLRKHGGKTADELVLTPLTDRLDEVEAKLGQLQHLIIGGSPGDDGVIDLAAIDRLSHVGKTVNIANMSLTTIDDEWSFDLDAEDYFSLAPINLGTVLTFGLGKELRLNAIELNQPTSGRVKLTGSAILADGELDEPSIEKLQGVFVIRGKVGGKYEVQYHTGDNEWQLRETVTLQANRQLYIDSSSYDEKRFYRVKLVE